MNKKDVYIIFDLDGTLVTSDQIKENETHFITSDYLKKINNMCEFFVKIRRDFNNVYIMTNRHPILKDWIIDFTQLPDNHIICRDYYLEPKDYEAIYQDKEKEKEFFKLMDEYKTRTLNLFANENRVIYIDDMADRFNKMELSNNVNVVFPPFIDIKVTGGFYNEWLRKMELIE